jgi:periplasmic protein TonB
MYPYLIVFALFTIGLTANSQQLSPQHKPARGVKSDGSDSVFTHLQLEKDPEFLKGRDALKVYVKTNLRIYGKSGKILVNFIVEPDGTLTNFKVLRHLGEGTSEEAIRVLREAGRWNPGIKDGQPVRCAHIYVMDVNL